MTLTTGMDTAYFAATQGSRALLKAQVKAGQVFPGPMRAYAARHGTLLIPTTPPPEPNYIRPAPTPVTVIPERAQRALEHVAKRMGTTADHMREPRRRRLTPARTRAIRLLKRMGYTLSQIGRFMNRNHATVIHHLKASRRAA